MNIRSFKRFLAATAASALLFTAVSLPADAARFGMSYLYFGSPSDYIPYVDAAGQALHVVSPSYFDLDKDGSLQPTDKIDPAFIDSMHERGIKVVPFLSNHWDREIGFKALDNRETLVAQIVDAVNTYHLDGVNVDIENVTEAGKDAYTDLVKNLREALPPSKEVSVAVSANPRGFTKGWHGSYDYAALASYSDYLMIMTYDETSAGEATPGPVASLSFMEQSIKYALKYAQPEQIVLGLPFYGRYWKTDGTMDGKGIAIKDVEGLVSRYGGKTRYDEATQSQVTTVTVTAAKPLPVVNYVTLTPGTYVIWHENETSMKRKLELVERYNLKGAGSWSLGQEHPGLWDFMPLWLNGAFFNDAEGHWAMQEIASVAYKGWMNGMDPGRFGPDSPLTRAQAATILARALLNANGTRFAVAASGSVAVSAAGSASAAGFTDVPASHWASGEIAAAKAVGIVDGVGDRRFEPDRMISREEMAAMLARALKLSASSAAGSVAFTDMASSSWAYPHVLALTERGILQGYEEGRFLPLNPISRAEMAALMHRLAPEIDQAIHK